MTAPILVTGAAGFAGSHLLDVLEKRPTPVVGWHRPDAAPLGSRRGVRWVSIEMLDRNAVGQALSDLRPSAVYHLAGAPHVARSWHNTLETYQGNVLVTHNLFEGLRAAKLRPRVIVAGSATIYRPQERPIHEEDSLAPASPYATSKLVQEMLARRAWHTDGLPTLIARSFNHVGPRQDPSFVASSIPRQIALIEAGRQEPVLMMGNLGALRDLTDVRDTVRAYVAMMDKAQPGRPYNVCSGRAVAIGTLVEAFIARAHVTVTVEQDPSRYRPNDVPILVGDHHRLSSDTGWNPEIPLARTVDDLLDYWRRRVREG